MVNRKFFVTFFAGLAAELKQRPPGTREQGRIVSAWLKAPPALGTGYERVLKPRWSIADCNAGQSRRLLRDGSRAITATARYAAASVARPLQVEKHSLI
jgi:hypothetical protein